MATRRAHALYGPFRISPGVGIKPVRVGDHLDKIRLFPETPHRSGRWVDLYRHGLEFVVRKGLVSDIIFYYRAKKHWTFDGSTEKGVGFASTIPDVLRAYGEPDVVGDTIVSRFGAFPGAHDCSLRYSRLGIDITFYDNQLADIRVYAPDPLES